MLFARSKRNFHFDIKKVLIVTQDDSFSTLQFVVLSDATTDICNMYIFVDPKKTVDALSELIKSNQYSIIPHV